MREEIIEDKEKVLEFVMGKNGWDRGRALEWWRRKDQRLGCSPCQMVLVGRVEKLLEYIGYEEG